MTTWNGSFSLANRSWRILMNWSTVLLGLTALTATAAEDIQPYPRQRLRMEPVQRWTFKDGTAGWTAAHNCSLSSRGGNLLIKATGEDPYFHGPAIPPFPHESYLVRLRMRCRTGGGGEIFWASRRSPTFLPSQHAVFPLRHDGRWHDYEVPLEVPGTLARLRLDPGHDPGDIEVAHIELYPLKYHPLEIEKVETSGRDICLRLRNHEKEAKPVSILGQSYVVPGGMVEKITLPAEGPAAFQMYDLKVSSPGLSTLVRPVFVFRPHAETEWLQFNAAGLTLQIARDGSGLRWLRGKEVVALAGPLLHREGVVPPLKLIEAGPAVRFQGEGVTLSFKPIQDEVHVAIEGTQRWEGPVLRLPGPLEQGVFAGLEYLSKGESSSSKDDIETPEHLRFAPDLFKVTLPLMACRTAQATAALTWTNMGLQPVFATPNFLDGCPGARMALQGRRIECVLRVSQTSLEEAIGWAVAKYGLPPLPKAPRDQTAQWDLCLKAINGPIKGANGWGHCAEPNWGRAPYADIASTIFRLTGKAPDLPRLVPGGAHIRNDTIYFITGRAEEWLNQQRRTAQHLIKQQASEGSYKYSGKFRKGHFEDTSSGFCAGSAAQLLEFARLTGDRAAQEAGLRTLEYMKRFQVPRGAQTWELSLHTPDILASAHLVQAYVRGFELTGKADYLAQARRWALSGVPFVYLWGNRPVMRYATVPVFGATHWVAPNWMGLPVQWCGLVYADALLLLAPHDRTLDWKHLAHGILLSGEQQQYPDGPYVGCLPDSFTLRGQGRQGPAINPGALVSLRLAVAGEIPGLALAQGGGHRLVAPFPAVFREGKFQIRAKEGLKYQVVLDGRRILDVTSKGTDVLPVE